MARNRQSVKEERRLDQDDKYLTPGKLFTHLCS